MSEKEKENRDFSEEEFEKEEFEKETTGDWETWDESAETADDWEEELTAEEPEEPAAEEAAEEPEEPATEEPTPEEPESDEEPEPDDAFENFDDEEYRGFEAEMEPDEPEDPKDHRRLWITLGAIAAAVVVAYLGVGIYFHYHFQPNSVVNGIACEYMTVEQLEDAITAQVHDYQLTIVERDDVEEVLLGADFDLHPVYDDTLTNLLHDQGMLRWPASFFRDSSYDPGEAVDWNEEEFSDALAALSCTNTARMVDPEDAKIEFSEEEDAFVVVPAVYGTHLQMAVFDEVITEAVSTLSATVNLVDTGCYEEPNVTEESTEMNDACEEMNLLIAPTITYDMLDIGEVPITKEEMSHWVTLSDTYEVSYSDEAIAAFVADFADQYDTRGKDHSLHTTWGLDVTVSTGTYGWQLDQEGEAAAIRADLEAGEDVTREPTWSRTAHSHGENDYGDTYVEINLTRQHLYFYKDGALVVDSDFVSGKMTTSRVTPDGIYFVNYKERDAVLKGEDYESPVSYWMPFNGGVGMHDATWRGSFGGSIYINSGSHGCINLPFSVAKTIFEHIDVGDCVFVYWEPNTKGAVSADPPKTTTNSSSDTSDQSSEEKTDSAEEKSTKSTTTDKKDTGSSKSGSGGSSSGSGSSGGGSSGGGSSGSGSSGSGSSGGDSGEDSEPE